MNNSRYALKCNYCKDKFLEENDLAIHQINHLTISVSFLSVCPFCDEILPNLCDGCDHVLEHFSSDKLEQCRLLRWLLHVIKNTHEQVNVPGKKKLHYYSTETRDYKLGDLTIDLPKIMPYLKCLVCERFIDPDIIREHLFGHFNIKGSKCKRILLWFCEFFKSKQASINEKRCNDYFEQVINTNLSSNMLARLPMFETPKTYTCRYQNCGMSVSDSAELFSHYMEWHGWSQIQCWFCIICNYNASSKEDLLEHFHNRHIACIFCKKKFSNFDICLSHVNNCIKQYCPYCKNKIAHLKELIKHVNKGSSDPICFYCKNEFDSSRDLRVHLQICTERPTPGVHCLSCRKFQFTNKDKFNEHLLECRPGSGSEVNPPCVNGTVKESKNSRKDNLIKYSEVKNCHPRIIDDISSKRYNFLLGKTCDENTTN